MHGALVPSICIFGVWIVSLCLHEYAHARVAFAGGDTTVAAKGYLSMNPLKYLHPVYSIVFPVLMILLGGIGLPGGAVWIETWRLRSRGWQSAVSVAGPAANLVMLVLLGLPFRLGMSDPDSESALWPALALSVYLQAMAIVLNLLPLPGLDGFGVLAPWLPRGAQAAAREVARYSMLVIFLLFSQVPAAGRAFGTAIFALTNVMQVPAFQIRAGWDLMPHLR